MARELGPSLRDLVPEELRQERDVEVEADPEPRVRGRELDRLADSVAGDHQARARDDPARVTVDDAAVDAGGEAEVVGVDDQALHGQSSPRSASRRAATARASKY